MKLPRLRTHVQQKKQKLINMDQRILNIIPENTFGFEGYEVLSENITYIFEVPEKHHHVVYEIDDFVSQLNIEYLYRSKLRECHATDKVHIAAGCNSTGAPRGYILNVNSAAAIKLEKELIIFSLLRDTVWTVTKIDNIRIELDKQQAQEEIFNSLFTIE